MSSTGKFVNRRTALRGALLTAGAAGALAATGGGSAWGASLVRSGRPVLTHGVQSGDVTASSATVWARSDRPAAMLVELAADPGFRHVRRVSGGLMLPGSDFTGKAVLPALPSGQQLYYRVIPVTFDGLAGEAVAGRLRTPSLRPDDVSFLWAGDLGGQGYGIDLSRGGYRIFEQMRRLDPDFYICNGDNIYADDPIEATVPLPTQEGTGAWHNVVTEAKSKVAETLDEYRGNYKYNLMDTNLRKFYAQVPQIQQWDDHETHNNWYPGEILDDPNYTEKRTDVLKYRAQQAFHEYVPMNPVYDLENRIYRVEHRGPLLDVFVLDMRFYRDANSPDKQTFNNGGILGFRQAEWLKRELAASRATWKVISNDMPLCEVVKDGDTNFEAVSQGDPGRPLGRENQIADILTFLKRRRIHNVVWLTTDVHYAAAHYFDPDKAAYQDFDPFWQFTAGPLSAGSFPPDATDTTFGAQQVFVAAPSYANASPASGNQFFGQVDISGASRAMTVRLRNIDGHVLWSRELPAQR